MVENEKKQKIVVVDDDAAQRLLLKMCLEGEGYEVYQADGGSSAQQLIEQHPDFRIVITDLDMPDINGFDLIRKIRARELHYTYIIVLTSKEDEVSLVKAFSMGADDYLAKPVNLNELRLRIRGALRVLRQETQEELILALAKLAEYRSDETGFHLERVQRYCRLLAMDLCENCPEVDIHAQFAEEIARVSPLHDIGKVAIPDNILHKPGKLTKTEFEIMKTHAAIGGQLLKDIYAQNGSPYLKVAYEVAMFHHERYDGTGYPNGLSGEEIPIAARIMALADIYDAMATKRCYKDPFPHEKIKNIILQERGKHLDPIVIDAFLRQEDVWLTVRDRFEERT
ncbi:MAG TPA: response regulator [Desulfobulbaceae bacterium]|nr:response regulator [Desulfobulbaceae bacterium]